MTEFNFKVGDRITDDAYKGQYISITAIGAFNFLGISSWRGDESRYKILQGNNLQWKLYQEPKKKVKRWLWARRGTGNPCISGALMTESEAINWCKDAIKLPGSEAEFEE